MTAQRSAQLNALFMTPIVQENGMTTQNNSTVQSEIDVLVIGGGPVGMTAAINLARFGVRLRIVDKKPTTVEHSHAVGVQVRTQEMLDCLGLIESFEGSGYRQTSLSMHGFGKRLGIVPLDHIDSPYKGLISIGQNITERLLLTHLESIGVTVERPVTATAFRQDETHAVVTLDRGNGQIEEVSAKYVISAEGSKSMVRETLAIPFVGARYENEVFVQTDAVVRWSYPLGVYMFINDGLTVILSPYNDKGLYRVIAAMPDPDVHNQTPPTLEEMQDYVRRGADPAATLSDPIWLTRYRTQHKAASFFRKGRAFLAGDAGHVHVPIGGQGMNTGMQDAVNLTWKVAMVLRGEAAEPLLDTYNEERHPVAEALLANTDTAFHTIITSSKTQAKLIETIGPVALANHFVQQKLSDTTAEINIAYPANYAVEDHGGSGGPAAGHRIPDALLVDAGESKTIRLFDLLRSPCFHVLLLTGTNPSEEDLTVFREISKRAATDFHPFVRTSLIAADPPSDGFKLFVTHWDRDLALHNKLGAHAAVIYVVRPDWYVGFRAPVHQHNTLHAYLSRIQSGSNGQFDRPHDEVKHHASK